MQCPRCQGEIEARAPACPHCAAPLELEEEPTFTSIDQELELDRRVAPRMTPSLWPGEAEPGPPSSEPAPAELDPIPLNVADAEGAPAILERVQTPPRPPSGPVQVELHFTVASAPQRVASWAIDGLLAGSLAWLLLALGAWLAGASYGDGPPLLPTALLAAALHFTHSVLGHALAGRTLGKWMMELELVGPDGRRPGPGRCALRALLALLSAGALGLGLLAALLHRRGLSPHDRIARTAVVRVP